MRFALSILGTEVLAIELGQQTQVFEESRVTDLGSTFLGMGTDLADWGAQPHRTDLFDG